MSKAHVDPAELRRFALDLKRFTDEIESLMGQLHGRMNSLEGSWRDQERKKIRRSFFTDHQGALGICGSRRRTLQFLNKKAVAIEQYLKQR